MQVLLDLCKFRNTHPAFNGSFEVLDAVADIEEYSEQMHAADASRTSTFLADRLGVPADVAHAPEGSGWCAPATCGLQKRREPSGGAPPSGGGVHLLRVSGTT